ncbi:hypothetical protein KY327_02140 [Candidatus Woesearchaeota archaeon]|nr:hypothetical protein [Candidatus Woesearchaeota archaeon]
MEVKNKEYLARGKRGVTYTGYVDGQKVLVKEHNPDSDADTIANEARMLRALNRHDVGPSFIDYEHGRLVREFVDGERIEEYLVECTPEEAKDVMRQVLDQCKTMDELGINKYEMTHPYKHILVTPEGEALMIDFERCRHTEKPKNVTQFCQYIARLEEKLGWNGVVVDGEKVKELGKRYKRDGYDDEAFQELKSLFA